MRLPRLLRRSPAGAPSKRAPRAPWPARVQAFARRLSYTALLLVAMAVLLPVGGVVVYKSLNAAAINPNPVPATGRINISARSKAQLSTLVLTSPQLRLVMVTEVDVRLNQRTSSWWFLDDPEAGKIRLRNGLPLPLFNSDPKNTQQLVRVFDNQFVCSPIAETIYFPQFSAVAARMPVLCQLAIPPPRFGLFAGILIFGLEAVSTPEEQVALRLEALRIATEIFLRGEIRH